ncbi:MAG: hypothetical protein M3O06_11785, partial [Pseudomonadota bacterium]|nr:hypothetical protein [Pseudomonadota bacterium]
MVYRCRLIVAFTIISTICGCMHLERFANRATDFNIQVADAQNKTLILNIVRAANRFPMHFTELSTLSGSGTVTTGGALFLPFASLNGAGSAFSAAPNASVSETPTFNVAVLETQEFYKGMLTPITLDQASMYLSEGVQPELIFKLVVGAILYQQPPGAKVATFENNFHRLKAENANRCPAEGANAQVVNEYACFNDVLRALLSRNLTTEQVHSVINVGPLVGQGAFNDLKWLNGFDSKVYKVASIDRAACEAASDGCPEGLAGLPDEQRRTLNRGERLFRIQKDNAGYRFCFDEDLNKRPPRH